MQIQEEKVAMRMSTEDLILIQVKDMRENLKDTRKELSERMNRLENRMDKLEAKLEKQDEKIDRLADKIDTLRRDLTGGTNHNQVMTGSIVAIALGVIYFVFTH